MGWTNSAQYFSSRIISEVLEPLNLFCSKDDGINQWVDDSLLYATTFDNLVKNSCKLFGQMESKCLRFSIKKCIFYAEEVTYCGRKLNSKGWRFDDSHWNKIRYLGKPKYVHDLCSAMYIAQWLATSVPRFAILRGKFAKLTELQGLTMKQLKQKNILLNWDESLEATWSEFKTLLELSAAKNMARFDNTKELTVMADASDNHWSAVILQPEEPRAHVNDVDFQPLVYLSGTFSASAKNGISA